jgi:hypothetical protein
MRLNSEYVLLAFKTRAKFIVQNIYIIMNEYNDKTTLVWLDKASEKINSERKKIRCFPMH